MNRAVSAAAAARHLFVNAVDDPPNASVYLGAIVKREDVILAISTSGRAPALAGLLREGLDRLLPADLDAWLRVADDERVRWKAAGIPMEARRPELLRALNAIYVGRAHHEGSVEPAVETALFQGTTPESIPRQARVSCRSSAPGPAIPSCSRRARTRGWPRPTSSSTTRWSPLPSSRSPATRAACRSASATAGTRSARTPSTGCWCAAPGATSGWSG